MHSADWICSGRFRKSKPSRWWVGNKCGYMHKAYLRRSATIWGGPLGWSFSAHYAHFLRSSQEMVLNKCEEWMYKKCHNGQRCIRAGLIYHVIHPAIYSPLSSTTRRPAERTMPQKVVQTPYPLIDADPHASRVLRYLRPFDYAVWAGATTAFPAALYFWGMYVSWRPSRRLTTLYRDGRPN